MAPSASWHCHRRKHRGLVYSTCTASRMHPCTRPTKPRFSPSSKCPTTTRHTTSSSRTDVQVEGSPPHAITPSITEGSEEPGGLVFTPRTCTPHTNTAEKPRSPHNSQITASDVHPCLGAVQMLLGVHLAKHILDYTHMGAHVPCRICFRGTHEWARCWYVIAVISLPPVPVVSTCTHRKSNAHLPAF